MRFEIRETLDGSFRPTGWVEFDPYDSEYVGRSQRLAILLSSLGEMDDPVDVFEQTVSSMDGVEAFQHDIPAMT
jgi:hypothetical protein